MFYNRLECRRTVEMVVISENPLNTRSHCDRIAYSHAHTSWKQYKNSVWIQEKKKKIAWNSVNMANGIPKKAWANELLFCIFLIVYNFHWNSKLNFFFRTFINCRVKKRPIRKHYTIHAHKLWMINNMAFRLAAGNYIHKLHTNQWVG